VLRQKVCDQWHQVAHDLAAQRLLLHTLLPLVLQLSQQTFNPSTKLLLATTVAVIILRTAQAQWPDPLAELCELLASLTTGTTSAPPAQALDSTPDDAISITAVIRLSASHHHATTPEHEVYWRRCAMIAHILVNLSDEYSTLPMDTVRRFVPRGSPPSRERHSSLACCWMLPNCREKLQSYFQAMSPTIVTRLVMALHNTATAAKYLRQHHVLGALACEFQATIFKAIASWFGVRSVFEYDASAPPASNPFLSSDCLWRASRTCTGPRLRSSSWRYRSRRLNRFPT